MDAFLDGLVDVVDELVLILDALDDPVVHLIDQNVEKAIVL